MSQTPGAFRYKIKVHFGQQQNTLNCLLFPSRHQNNIDCSVVTEKKVQTTVCGERWTDESTDKISDQNLSELFRACKDINTVIYIEMRDSQNLKVHNFDVKQLSFLLWSRSLISQFVEFQFQVLICTKNVLTVFWILENVISSFGFWLKKAIYFRNINLGFSYEGDLLFYWFLILYIILLYIPQISQWWKLLIAQAIKKDKNTMFSYKFGVKWTKLWNRVAYTAPVSHSFKGQPNCLGRKRWDGPWPAVSWKKWSKVWAHTHCHKMSCVTPQSGKHPHFAAALLNLNGFHCKQNASLENVCERAKMPTRRELERDWGGRERSYGEETIQS